MTYIKNLLARSVGIESHRISWKLLEISWCSNTSDNALFFTLEHPALRDAINGLLEITDLLPQSLKVQSFRMQFSA